MKTGNPNSYPFDSYSTLIRTTAYILPTNNGLPFTIFTLGAVQGFIYKTTFESLSDDGSDVIVSFNIQRSATTRIFAAIVFLRECAR